MNKHYKTQYTDLTPQVNQIITAGVRVLVYNGDVDSVCNFKGFPLSNESRD